MSLLGLSTAISFLLDRSGLGVWLYALFAIIGVSAFVLSIYHPLVGLAASVVFYLPQIFSYASAESYWQFQMGLHFFMSTKTDSAVYGLNILALILFLIAAAKTLDRWDERKVDVPHKQNEL